MATWRAIGTAENIRAIDSPAARWIASDALRELRATPSRDRGCPLSRERSPRNTKPSVNDPNRRGAPIGGVAHCVAGSGESRHHADQRGAASRAVFVA